MCASTARHPKPIRPPPKSEDGHVRQHCPSPKAHPPASQVGGWACAPALPVTQSPSARYPSWRMGMCASTARPQKPIRPPPKSEDGHVRQHCPSPKAHPPGTQVVARLFCHPFRVQDFFRALVPRRAAPGFVLAALQAADASRERSDLRAWFLQRRVGFADAAILSMQSCQASAAQRDASPHLFWPDILPLQVGRSVPLSRTQSECEVLTPTSQQACPRGFRSTDLADEWAFARFVCHPERSKAESKGLQHHPLHINDSREDYALRPPARSAGVHQPPRLSTAPPPIPFAH